MKTKSIGYRAVVCISISGLCVGYLTGLSISPVVGVVVASIVALVVSLTSALAGLDLSRPTQDPTHPEPTKAHVAVNPLPTAVLLLGISFGSVIGIWTRTHDWLGTLHGNGAIGKSEEVNRSDTGALFAATESECQLLPAVSDANALRQRLKETKAVTQNSGLNKIVDNCGDIACLKNVLEAICGK